MADVGSILANPDFQALPLEERRKVFATKFKDFVALPTAEQDRVITRKVAQQTSPPSAPLPPVGAALGERAMVAGSPAPGTAPQGLVDFGKAVLDQAPEIALSVAFGGAAPMVERGIAGKLPALAGVAKRVVKPALTALGGVTGLTAGDVASGKGIPESSAMLREALLAGGTQFAVDEAGRLLFSPKRAQELAGVIRGKVAPATRGLAPVAQQAAEADINTELQGIVPRLAADVRTQTKRMYGRVESAGRGIPDIGAPEGLATSIRNIDTVTREQFTGDGKKILDEIEARVTPGQTKTLNASGQPDLVPPKPVPFKQLLDWESRLRELEPTSFAQRLHPDDKTGGIISNLRYQVSQEIDNAALISPETRTARQEAKQYFKSQVVPFREMNDHVLAKSVGPNDVIDVLSMQGRSDRLASFISRLSPEEQSMARASYFSQKLREATDDLGIFDDQTFLASWKKLSHQNQALIAGTDGAEITKAIRSLNTDARNRTLKKGAGYLAGGAGVLESLRQASYAFKEGDLSKAGGIIVAGSAAGFILPALLSRPIMVRWWNLGHQAPVGSRLSIRAGSAIAQTIAHAVGALAQHAADQQPQPQPAPVPQTTPAAAPVAGPSVP